VQQLPHLREIGARTELASETIIETPAVFICRHCGAPMIVIDILARTAPIRAPPTRPGKT
jgi:hypothetical protein